MALVCFAVAFAHAVIWAFVTPLNQVPDEPAHASYAEYIAQQHTVPAPGHTLVPSRQASRLGAGLDTLLAGMPFSAEADPGWTKGADRLARRLLAQPGANAPGGAADYVKNNPPLYYAVEALPAAAAGSASVIDRMTLMRAVTALFAGATALFCFLFVRELLPGVPWAWSVGGLAVAFHPLLGFLGGGVTPDPLLFAWAAALFWLIARAYRRGMTVRQGIALGLVAAGGCLTKGTMFGLLPGAAVACVGAAFLKRRLPRRRALLSLAAGAAAFAIPFGLWLFANSHLFDRTASTTTSGFTSGTPGGPTLSGQLSYTWQFYLPKLPSQTEMFPDFPHYPLWQTWVQGFVGRFGWHQFGFPLWANVVGLVVLVAIAAFALRELVRRRARVRAFLPELIGYALMVLGLLAVITVAAYRYRVATGSHFEQARYILPLLPLYAALVVLAVRGVGRRWGPAVGAGFVTLTAAHALLAMVLSLGRYYTG